MATTHWLSSDAAPGHAMRGGGPCRPSSVEAACDRRRRRRAAGPRSRGPHQSPHSPTVSWPPPPDECRVLARRMETTAIVNAHGISRL